MSSAWNSWVLMHLLSTPQDWRKNGCQGRDVLLAFQKYVGFVLSEASDYYSEAIIRAKQVTPCDDMCWTTIPLLMEPSMTDTLSRPFHSIFFSLWPRLNITYKEGAATLTDTPKTERPHSLFAWECPSTKIPERESCLKCLTSMASAFHTTGCYRYVLSWEMHQSASTRRVGWYVHQFCEKGCSLHPPWTT